MMRIAQLLLASPVAGVAAASIAQRSQSAHQISISATLPFDAPGPGPFQADERSSIAPYSSPASSLLGSLNSQAQTSFSLCSGVEGSIQVINNVRYRTYCYNSLWDSYIGLGYHNTVEACESAFTSSPIDPKVGFHWYPSTGGCFLFNSPSVELYVYHYGNYEKVFFAPLDKITPPDGPLCPLNVEGGWSLIAGQWHRLYCRGMAKVESKDVRNYGKTTTNITECASWALGEGAKMWHWWQPSQDGAPGLGSGQRNCEAIMTMPSRLVPLRTKDTYIAGVPEFKAVGAVDMYAGEQEANEL